MNAKNDTLKFIDCALEIEKSFLNANTSSSFKWFIASDSTNSLNDLLESYPNKAFAANGSLSHIAYNTDGYMRTLLDVELLSLSNEIIVTGGSTFGWIAAMKMQKLPFYVNGFSSMKKCMRATLSDPPVIPAGFAVF